jgi:hypothetical protein
VEFIYVPVYDKILFTRYGKSYGVIEEDCLPYQGMVDSAQILTINNNNNKFGSLATMLFKGIVSRDF